MVVVRFGLIWSGGLDHVTTSIFRQEGEGRGGGVRSVGDLIEYTLLRSRCVTCNPPNNIAYLRSSLYRKSPISHPRNTAPQGFHWTKLRLCFRSQAPPLPWPTATLLPVIPVACNGVSVCHLRLRLRLAATEVGVCPRRQRNLLLLGFRR